MIPGRQTRGSTLILVLALLSILVFLAAALIYMSRLEGITSSGFSRSTQSRVAAATGLPRAAALARSSVFLTAPLQAWSRAMLQSVEQATGVAAAAQASGGVTVLPTQRLSSSSFQINDLCARVNVNAITSERALDRFLGAIERAGASQADSAAANGESPATMPQLKGSGLMRYRRQDSRTTTAVEADLRKPALTGQKRFLCMADVVQALDGNGATARPVSAMRADDLQMLGNYLTVFSQSPEVFNPDGRQPVPKYPLARLDDASSVAAALIKAFPEKDERLLLQYAANLADFADADTVPTVLADPKHPEPWHVVIGSEQTPFISEVYPDSATQKHGRDDGQYVEIYNPWTRTLTLRDWKLVVSGGVDGIPGTCMVTINVSLPPHGYLIVTDNYDQPFGDAPAGEGCFLAVFGVRRDDNLHKLVDDRKLDLPDTNSYVSLLDDRGNLIDVFSYTSAAAANSHQSYQRNDPRVRSFDVADATPFEHPPQGVYTATSTSEDVVDALWKYGNKPFESPVDLLKVSTAYDGLGDTTGGLKYRPHPWQMPAYQRHGEASSSNIDAGVLDMFTAVVPESSGDAQTSSPRGMNTPRGGNPVGSKTQTPASAGPDSQRIPATAGGGQAPATSGTLLYAYGRLNLNTCPKFALLALDADVGGNPLVTPAFLDKFETYRLKRLAARRIPFRNVSEFLLEFFPKPEERQMEALGKLANQLTVSSSSFEITTENRAPVQDKPDTVPPARSRSVWTVALDKEPYSLIHYSLAP